MHASIHSSIHPSILPSTQTFVGHLLPFRNWAFCWGHRDEQNQVPALKAFTESQIWKQIFLTTIIRNVCNIWRSKEGMTFIWLLQNHKQLANVDASL
jgi:hypothetical protein